jgi:type VI protein secretion system component VasF
MNSRRPGRVSWAQDRRAEYNRWAGRHTWLISAIVAALLAVLLILIVARLSHQPAPLPDVSISPHTDQGRQS